MNEIEEKVKQLMARMTLEEKVALCHAGSKFAVAGNERLGIPEFRMSDGPHGVRREISRDSWDPVETDEDTATYLPTGTALAATWNPELGRLFGEVLGAEAKDRGKDVILGPGINIVRTPICGRNFEYYGEDPHHISAMVVPVIEGIQSQDVAACVKHYAANSQELRRNHVDARMDERTLREIYLPAFEAAVVRGKCLTVMGAYNRFRGQYCCHQEYLVNTVLKGEWNFQGSYISDWAGTENTTEAVCNGLDIEMGTSKPYEEYYLARPFLEATRRGDFKVDLLDDKVRRNLRVMFSLGMFDQDRKKGERNTTRHQQAALAIAREAIVLLKNEKQVLPLAREDIRRLVVIGDNATVLHALGGNSSGVKAHYEITPLEGLRNKLGAGTEILYFRGYPAQETSRQGIPSEYLGTADEGAGTKGWKGRYFGNRDQEGEAIERADADINFDWCSSAPFEGWKAGQFSVSWKSTLVVPKDGPYKFVLEGANHAGLNLDGQDLIQRWENRAENTVSKTIILKAGRVYPLSIYVKPSGEDVSINLGWVPPWFEEKAEDRTDLLNAVQNADAVLFFGGLNHQYDVEGSDRPHMALPDGQNELLEQISGKNPKTAVILIAGSPVEMPWAESVPAIVQMWYAGMEGGNAIADVLFGDENPSGKLPMTFPKALIDSPAHALEDYAPDICNYLEGILVGYRWYDAKNVAPLFPFGHGLSYTSFRLTKMELRREGENCHVTLEITNTGSRTGAEVVQIYVGQPSCPVMRPVRELKAFAKVKLQAGEVKRLEWVLSAVAFSFWDTADHAWKIEPGLFVIEAGVSSRQIHCQESLQMG